jgi:hypothetical protein
VTCVQTGSGAGDLEIYLILYEPYGCITHQALSNPLAIVKVPRPAVSATFDTLRKVERPCSPATVDGTGSSRVD